MRNINPIASDKIINLANHLMSLSEKYPFDSDNYCRKEKFHEFNSALDSIKGLTLFEFMGIFRNGDAFGIRHDIFKINKGNLIQHNGKPLEVYDTLDIFAVLSYINYYALEVVKTGIDTKVGAHWRKFLINLIECSEYMYLLNGKGNFGEAFRIGQRIPDTWMINDDDEIVRIERCSTYGENMA